MTIGLIAFLGGLSVLITFYALSANKSPMSRIDRLHQRDTQRDSDDKTSLTFSKYIRPMLNELLPSFPGIKNMSDSRRSSLEDLIIRSGNPWNLRPDEFIGSQVLFALVGSVFGLFLVFMDSVSMPWFLLVGGLAVAGYLVPYSTYNTARQKRSAEIRRSLPEALDLLVITMSAGLNFEPSLKEVTARLPDGLLHDEFATISREIESGRTLESALMSFSNRAASPEAESFAKSVARSQRLGADVTETLSSQSTSARDAYEAMIDKKIAKLSSAMFAFLAPTMLPAFVLIFVAPSLAQLSGGFI